jgi:hypothetical protein
MAVLTSQRARGGGGMRIGLAAESLGWFGAPTLFWAGSPGLGWEAAAAAWAATATAQVKTPRRPASKPACRS